jgi:uncharacterized protein YpmS
MNEQIWKQRFMWLLAQHWVESEAIFRLELEQTDDNEEFISKAIKAIDEKVGVVETQQETLR